LNSNFEIFNYLKKEIKPTNFFEINHKFICLNFINAEEFNSNLIKIIGNKSLELTNPVSLEFSEEGKNLRITYIIQSKSLDYRIALNLKLEIGIKSILLRPSFFFKGTLLEELELIKKYDWIELK